MRTALVAMLAVGVLPAMVMLHRTGLLRRRAGRIAAAVAGGAAVVAALPRDGLSLEDQKLFLMLLAAAATAVTAAWGGGAWNRRRAVGWLAAITFLAAAAAVNFGAFHGGGTWVHLHDVAHYHLGAKYFDEVGYEDLYVAVLRAEAERYDDHFRTLTARDLATDRLVDIRQLLRASGPVKARFTPERWRAFTTDVAMFRDRMGPLWAGVVTDHGYNATPVLTALARPLANLVPAGSYGGVRALTLIDPVLIAAALAAAAWGFGRTGALLAALHLSILFGAGFAWTGGGFLRFGWWFGFVAALACLERRRWRTAGVLLAVATGLRLFPAAFVVGVALHGLWKTRAGGRVPRCHLRLGAAFAVTLAALIASTAGLPDTMDRWHGFADRIRLQAGTLSPNLVGATQVLAYWTGPPEVSHDELLRLQERRRRIHRRQIAVLLPLVLALVALAARRLDATSAAMLGAPLLLATVNLASYDMVLLVGLVLVWRRRPRDLTLVFAVELASYVLLLFADRDAAVYALRSVLVAFLLALLFVAQPTSSGAGRPK